MFPTSFISRSKRKFSATISVCSPAHNRWSVVYKKAGSNSIWWQYAVSTFSFLSNSRSLVHIPIQFVRAYTLFAVFSFCLCHFYAWYLSSFRPLGNKLFGLAHCSHNHFNRFFGDVSDSSTWDWILHIHNFRCCGHGMSWYGSDRLVFVDKLAVCSFQIFY